MKLIQRRGQRSRDPYPPEFDYDPPCELCGEPRLFACPECPRCGVVGDPACREAHQHRFQHPRSVDAFIAAIGLGGGTLADALTGIKRHQGWGLSVRIQGEVAPITYENACTIKGHELVSGFGIDGIAWARRASWNQPADWEFSAWVEELPPKPSSRWWAKTLKGLVNEFEDALDNMRDDEKREQDRADGLIAPHDDPECPCGDCWTWRFSQ